MSNPIKTMEEYRDRIAGRPTLAESIRGKKPWDSEPTPLTGAAYDKNPGFGGGIELASSLEKRMRNAEKALEGLYRDHGHPYLTPEAQAAIEQAEAHLAAAKQEDGDE
jgi:hypothetical protein